MAFYYYKVPPHIAEEMGLTNKPEKRLKDGNYLAFISHMKMFCSPLEAPIKAASMGCLALRPVDMIDELDPNGTSRPLPEPTDPRFFPPKKPVVIEVEEEAEIVEEAEGGQQEALEQVVINVSVEDFLEQTQEESAAEEETETNEEGGE